MSGARRWLRILRRAAALAAGAWLGLMFLRMGVVKLDPDGFWTAAFERWGYPVWLRVAVGAVEAAGGPLLVVPWLASWAGLALAGVMVGAGLTRAGDGRWVDVAWIAFYLAGCLWIAWEWRGLALGAPARRDPLRAHPP